MPEFLPMAQQVWEYATRRLSNLGDVRAAYIDQLNFNLLEKLQEIDAEVEGLAGAAMRGTNNVDTATMRGTNSAALASAWTAALATNLGFHGRSLEAYTPVINVESDNDATLVTVLNITGRGIFVGCGGQSNVYIYLKVVVDGVTIASGGDAFTTSSGVYNMPMSIGFDTSLLVQMKLNASGSAKYWAVANVE